MHTWPLSFREFPDQRIIMTDDSGCYFMANRDFVERYALGHLTEADATFLQKNGHTYQDEGDLSHTAFMSRWVQRQHVGGDSAYVILIPTLRCDLKCSYCQVSRAPLTVLDHLPGNEIQIEFQGGEPFLRLDHIKAVAEFARQRFHRVHFVVCTNLQTLNDEILEFIKSDDVFISTSLDGPHDIHTRNRTANADLTREFNRNLSKVIKLVGPEKVSALPTIDIEDVDFHRELTRLAS
jgi:uncharacterized Fe-S cluster-containing radical SAM superfamily protein